MIRISVVIGCHAVIPFFGFWSHFELICVIHLCITVCDLPIAPIKKNEHGELPLKLSSLRLMFHFGS